ncbi:hypothetical protein O181_034504 [Austropuccinia psidii MF-1]|uniref:Reverse transcriptase Ty1/copia-type domain-containing protein n=1 Tax=Austropuccinia psidii MF-1 TaxID=1389203 RepID=A0A9Q3D0V6_9BASI|nr:hypothetical protein [Austropuccinia psidii MF-1]
MHIFDNSMIKEIALQDRMVSSLNSNCKISNIIPTTYKEAFELSDSNKWKAEINNELSSMNDEKVFTIGSQPDIAYAVNYLARFLMCSKPNHWNALEHLIAYLRRTQDLGILISTDNSKNKLTCYVNENWDGEGNHLTHSYLLLHGKNPIAWQSKQYIIVASSTAQAEYISLSFAEKECLWISHLFASTTGHLTPYMLSDNKTAIKISNESLSRKQTHHLIRDLI